MKTAFVIVLFFAVSGLTYHICHELFHIIAGRICGLSLISVKWFSFHGGTKVTFKGEEDIINSNEVPRSWLIMSLAGIIGTTLMSYIFVLVYLLLPVGYVKLLFWVLSATFLISDPGYSVLCSLSGTGDLYLISRQFNNSILIKIISVTVLAADLIVFIIIT